MASSPVYRGTPGTHACGLRASLSQPRMERNPGRPQTCLPAGLLPAGGKEGISGEVAPIQGAAVCGGGCGGRFLEQPVPATWRNTSQPGLPARPSSTEPPTFPAPSQAALAMHRGRLTVPGSVGGPGPTVLGLAAGLESAGLGRRRLEPSRKFKCALAAWLAPCTVPVSAHAWPQKGKDHCQVLLFPAQPLTLRWCQACCPRGKLGRGGRGGVVPWGAGWTDLGILPRVSPCSSHPGAPRVCTHKTQTHTHTHTLFLSPSLQSCLH